MTQRHQGQRRRHYARRQHEVERHGGNVAAAIFHLADTLPFDDDEMVLA